MRPLGRGGCQHAEWGSMGNKSVSRNKEARKKLAYPGYEGSPDGLVTGECAQEPWEEGRKV